MHYSFSAYDTGDFYDELFQGPGAPRKGAQLLADKIESLPEDDLERRQAAAEQALFDLGITFTVYGHDEGTEKIFPFDLIPRVVTAKDWAPLEQGLKQRITALNLFIDDIYHSQKILKDRVAPAELISSASGYFPVCRGLKPPRGVWCHVTGTDLVRDSDGQFYVLEDNLRCPSGVSYVLANRHLMKRTFPEVFTKTRIRPVDEYPAKLLEMLYAMAPPGAGFTGRGPTVALLTPGPYNSAYFEHSFLALHTGMELVQGTDLVVENNTVYMRTTKGLQRVDIIYRRLNDDFMDPLVFRPDSMLGVPGLMDSYRAGNVSLANAPGTGVADDKVIYAYVPDIIKYYLDEEPIIPNVPTYLPWRPADLDHVLANLETLVVKSANESGGYGMLVGPASTEAEREDFARRIKANPRNFIAQPTLALSRAPVITPEGFKGRHVDLRPYILHYGEDVYVMPGGLTRVALREGSLVVNSSQGGGSKDTWVLSSSAEESDAVPPLNTPVITPSVTPNKET